MDPWWTRCPICDARSKPAGDPFGVRFYRWVQRHPILWGMDLAPDRLTTFSSICPTHGTFEAPTLRFEPLHCQHCDYNLHACRGKRCPECGWAIPLPLRHELQAAGGSPQSKS